MQMKGRRKIIRYDVPRQKASEGKSAGNQNRGDSEIESESPWRHTSETFIIILFTLALAPPRPNSQIHIRNPLRGRKRYREDDELPVIRRFADLQNRPVLGQSHRRNYQRS